MSLWGGGGGKPNAMQEAAERYRRSEERLTSELRRERALNVGHFLSFDCNPSPSLKDPTDQSPTHNRACLESHRVALESTPVQR